MKNSMTRSVKRFLRDPRNLFYLISGVGILLYLYLSFRLGGGAYAWMVQENKPEIRFIDYFSHLERAIDPTHLYQQVSRGATESYAAVFPPLAYCMYYVLYRLTAVRGGLAPGTMVETIPGALSVFSIYLIFNALIFFLAIGMTGQRNRRKDVMIFSLLMLSAVFAGSGYMLGNSAMLVVALLMAGLRLRESQYATRREAGLLILAVCVALKLYPAVFGLVFLKEKKYRELVRLIVYSLLLLLVPFAFFGGVEGISAWIGNFFGPLQSAGDYGRIQYLRGAFYTLIRLLTGREEAIWSTVLTVGGCLVWAWLAWRSRSKTHTVFFLTCIMVLFPTGAYRYTLAYFCIPLVMMLKEEPEEESGHGFTAAVSALYGMIFTVPVWWLAVIPMERRYSLNILTSVEICLYLAIYVLIAVMMFAELAWPGLKNRRGTETWH